MARRRRMAGGDEAADQALILGREGAVQGGNAVGHLRRPHPSRRRMLRQARKFDSPKARILPGRIRSPSAATVTSSGVS